MVSRRWLGALALAAAFAVAAVFLGRWQWHRHEDKAARAERIASHYDAAPVSLPSVLAKPQVPLARPDEWTPVRVTGRYAADSLLLVRNRPNDGVFGYEVLVPLELPSGGALLVDRGWVPNAATAASRPDVPATPLGIVTATGWLRIGEPSLGRQLPVGQLASINIQEAQRQTSGRLFGAYLILRDEQGADGGAPARPRPLEPPDTGEGPHLAYAIQWWASAPVGFLLVFYGARREHLDAVADATPAARERVPVAGPPRKVRIWDEEDS